MQESRAALSAGPGDAAVPAARRVAITGGTVLSMDPVLGDLQADVLVIDGDIASVGTEVALEEAEIIDATGCYVLPGFVDTHRHAWQAAVRHAAVGWDVEEYMTRGHGVVSPRLTASDVYLGDTLGALTALDSGITTVCDECHAQHSPAHTEGAVRALQDSGIRARFGYGWSAGSYVPEDAERGHPADMERVRERLLPDDDTLVTMYAMLRGPGMAAPAANRDDMRRARALGLRMSMHVAHTRWPDAREITHLAQEGSLADDVVLIHAGAATDDELRMVADARAFLSISPAVESVMAGVGLPITSRALAAGLRPGLSIDTEIAGPGDMFTVMRTAYTTDHVIRMLCPGPADAYPPLTPRILLELATFGGAHAAGLGDTVGSVTPGKRADIILIDADAPNMISSADPATAILTSAHTGNVRTVLVDGEVRKQAGTLRDIRRVTQLKDEVLRAAHRLTA
jgi:5-methylthioadenosine/S-adenosylhomocysteine deaminase